MILDSELVRQQFPSLHRSAVFLDNPAGTQIAKQSLDRINRYLLDHNANHEGLFETSRRSDEVLHEAHAAMADFLNASRPEEIIFGNNMTTLTLHMSRSLARNLQPGDNILVTRLDHDANISPWMLIAEDAGALVYIDAVQYAPHGPIDVQDLDCDFLVCSSYKFFGPHAGALYGKYDLLHELKAYKVRPAANDLPYKFETGTQNHEGIAGVLGALEYFEWLGAEFGGEYANTWKAAGFSGRRLIYKQAMSAIREYEFELSRALIGVVESVSGTRIYGVTAIDRVDERVPTVSF